MRPPFLTGSPPCMAFLSLQNLSRAKRYSAVVNAELDAARDHFIFCISLYKIPIKRGRCVVHEHPHDAASRTEECLVRIAAMEGAETASVDMCAYGVQVDTGAVQGPALKRTNIMRMSNEVIKRIAVNCPKP